jgi:hypothetical protein
VSERIRAGSRFKQFLHFSLIDVSYLCVSPGVRVHQVEKHWSRKRGSRDVSQACGTPWPVTELELLLMAQFIQVLKYNQITVEA